MAYDQDITPYTLQNHLIKRSRAVKPKMQHPLTDLDLSGTTVVVTGASRGIGKAIAFEFARSGANVACAARTSMLLDIVVSEINNTTSGRAIAICADLSEPSTAQLVCSRTLEEFGPIDIVVNNAATIRLNKFEDEENFKTWWEVIETNLRGSLAMIHAVLPGMLARERGCLITIGSRNAAGSHPYMTAYSASKTALLRFHHCLELEIKGRGVYNYFVHPGTVATSLLHKEGVTDPRRLEENPELGQMLERIASRSTAQPELAARVCIQLFVDDALKCLSGRYVDAEQDLHRVARIIRGDIKSDVDYSGIYQLTMDQLCP